jgi:hypothetical protein
MIAAPKGAESIAANGHSPRLMTHRTTTFGLEYRHGNDQ